MDVSATGGQTETEFAWERCEVAGCSGARVADLARCLAHLDERDLDAQLRRFSRGRPLDARGASISARLWHRIYEAAPDDGAGTKRLSTVDFTQATIDGAVDLGGVFFAKNTSFQGTRFRGPVTLTGATVKGQAQFSGAVFQGGLNLDQARLEGPAWFAGARFDGPVSFVSTTFWAPAWFTEAKFSQDADFGKARFERSASFRLASFSARASFEGAEFGADGDFEQVQFASAPAFAGAAFKGGSVLPRQARTRSTKWWGPPLASWGQRIAASLIDVGVLLGICAMGIGAAFGLNWLGQYLLANVSLFAGPAVALYWSVRNASLQGWSGQSLGKRVVGLRLISERDRRPIGRGRSVARGFLHLFDTLPLFLGWLRPLWHPKRQTIADTMVNSVVVVVGRNFAQANAVGPAKRSAASTSSV